jgi:hypothetical protein
MSKRKNRASKPSTQAPVISGEALQDAAITEQMADDAAAPAPTEPKKTRSHRPAGLGHPDAKKLVNPQHTLELKKDAAKKLGGKMLWVNKHWVVNVPAGEFTFASRAMAALSVATFIEAVSKAPAKVEPADVDTEVEDEAEAA